MIGAVVLLCAFPCEAVEVASDIDEDTAWTAADGPYEVVVDITVGEGVTLTIEAGATVVVSEGVSVGVNGEVRARGTASEPVLFTGVEDGDDVRPWGSLAFADDSSDAVFEDVDEYVSGSILEYVRFEFGSRAVSTMAASPYIHSCEFENNSYEGESAQAGAGALYIGPGSAPRIVGNTFTGNEATGNSYGGAIYVDDAAPVIQDNLFSGNVSAYGGAVTTYLMYSPVVGNTFEDNFADWEGGGISFVSSSPALLDNTFTGNSCVLDGGGVHVCVTCFPHANPFLMDNTVAGNSNTFLGAGGVGAAYLRMFVDNNLTDNLLDGEPADFAWNNEALNEYPDWVVNTSVAHNWWGTTDASFIEDTIHDGHDEDTFGLVSFDPPLDGPVTEPTPRVTLTTRRIEYETPGEPMPLFLTIYNPGAEQEVLLSLSLQYGDAMWAPYDGQLDYPGAVREGELFRIQLPERSAYFTTLHTPEYADSGALGEGSWHAAMFDADGGERLGDVCSSRFQLGEGG